jgi:cytochrome c5
MQQKDFGLVFSLAIVIFLAVSSPKKIPIAKGYAVSHEQLDRGEALYTQYCRECHNESRDGAPAPSDSLTWKKRLKKGFSGLIGNAVDHCGRSITAGGGALLTEEDIAIATAYMIATSKKNGRSPRRQRWRAG